MSENVVEQMRTDWNARAAEDAHYYVAFGRREQDDEEFQSTGDEVVHGLEWEMRRFGAIGDKRAMRALEIGCGPGRLMRPMSSHFGEIHGVDISDQMVAREGAWLLCRTRTPTWHGIRIWKCSRTSRSISSTATRCSNIFRAARWCSGTWKKRFGS